MKIRQSIFRRGRTGGDIGRIQNAWTLRLTHIDDHENKTSKTWQYATKQSAKDDLEKRKAELVAFVESKGRDLGDVKTFKQWADYAKSDFYRPAVVMDGRKVAGVKSYKSAHILIDQLVEFFGNKQLAKFTKHDLDRYKVWRLEQGDRRGNRGALEPHQRNTVKISTVNRSLAILKHLLIEAHEAGLIVRDVTRGSKAIDSDAETERVRTLTDSEEMRLLSSCGKGRKIECERNGKTFTSTKDANNPYLKAVILLGLDSGMRKNEVLKLEWKDIDIERGVIRILGTHTKTEKTRRVPLTDRTKAELLTLSTFGDSGRVFPFKDFKRSFATAVRIAKIEGLTFRDLRRTFVTRLQTGGVTIGIAAELAGHARNETTQKYYTSTDNTAVIMDAAQRINEANDARRNLWPDTIE